jgi:hypothetical protein
MRLGSNPHPALITMKKFRQSRAFWYGWIDGRYRGARCFTENRRLADWEAGSERLDYYRGHRAGQETRQRRGLLFPSFVAWTSRYR